MVEMSGAIQTILLWKIKFRCHSSTPKEIALWVYSSRNISMDNHSTFTDEFSWLKGCLNTLYDQEKCLTILFSTTTPVPENILLSDCELYKAQKFRCSLHSRRYIIGRKLLRFLLNLETCKTPLQTSQKGKPYIKNGSVFSISYSENYIVLCLSLTRTIGVDIECLFQDVSYIDIPKNVFHDTEMRWIYDNERSLNRRRLTCWTRKEAVVKADGTGLDEDIKYINTCPDLKNGLVIPYKNYRLWTFNNKINNFIISVAADNDITDIVYLDFCHLSKDNKLATPSTMNSPSV